MEMHKKNPSAPQEIMKDQHDQTDTLAIPLDSSEEEEEEEMEMLKREQRQLQNRAHESQNTHLNNAPHNP